MERSGGGETQDWAGGGGAHRIIHCERDLGYIQPAVKSQRNILWDLEVAIARGRFRNDSTQCGGQRCHALGVEVPRSEKGVKTFNLAHW